MSYSLEGFVARTAVFDEEHRRGLIDMVPLAQSFALVPLTDHLHNFFPDSTGQPYQHMYTLTPALADWAAELSVIGAVAFLEAEFFGGTGAHASIVWRSKEVVLVLPANLPATGHGCDTHFL